MVASYNDKELIVLLSESNGEAYIELYNRYRRGIYSFLLRYVKVPALAEDLLQDVFLKVWEVRHRLNPEMSFSAYLFQIARNRVFKMLKAIAHDEALRARVLNRLSETISETENRVQWQKYHQLLHSAIDALPPQRQKVFKLCREQGKTYEQVAAEMHISRHTVKEHMTLAMKDIKDYVSRKADVSLVLFLLTNQL